MHCSLWFGIYFECGNLESISTLFYCNKTKCTLCNYSKNILISVKSFSSPVWGGFFILIHLY